MMWLQGGVLVVALFFPVLIVVAQVVRGLATCSHQIAKSRCVERIATMLIAEEEPSDERIYMLRRLYRRRIVVESVIYVAESVYGEALSRLVCIIEVCEIDYYLLRQLHRARGDRRVQLLRSIARLAEVLPMFDELDLCCNTESRECRFYAMKTLIASHPERSVRHIAQFPSLMTTYEISTITQVMRRVGTTMAYTPMLVSQSRNIQLIGIHLVEQLLIADAEAHLQRLVESDDREIAYVALHALCAIRGDISTPQVYRAMRTFAPHHRASVLRHAVCSCYSLQSCANIFNCDERNRFLQLTNSYKCSMLCN